MKLSIGITIILLVTGGCASTGRQPTLPPSGVARFPASEVPFRQHEGSDWKLYSIDVKVGGQSLKCDNEGLSVQTWAQLSKPFGEIIAVITKVGACEKADFNLLQVSSVQDFAATAVIIVAKGEGKKDEGFFKPLVITEVRDAQSLPMNCSIESSLLAKTIHCTGDAGSVYFVKN